MFLPFKFQSYCRKAETAGRKWARGGRSGRGKSDSPWSGGRLGGWGQTVCTCSKSHRYCSHCRSSLFVVYFQFSHLISNSNDSSTSSTLHMHSCSLIHLYTYHMHVPTHRHGHRHICIHTHTHTLKVMSMLEPLPEIWLTATVLNNSTACVFKCCCFVHQML